MFSTFNREGRGKKKAQQAASLRQRQQKAGASFWMPRLFVDLGDLVTVAAAAAISAPAAAAASTTTAAVASATAAAVASATTAAVASATTAAVASATTAAVASATTATASAASAFTRAGFVDHQRASADIAAIDGGNCLLRFVFGCHFDKSEAARLAGVAIRDDLSGSHVAGLSEQVMEFLVGHLVAQIADIKFGCHWKEWLLSVCDAFQRNVMESVETNAPSSRLLFFSS
jgi:hypothetical protein